MNESLNLKAEPFEMESSAEEFGEEGSGDFEFGEENDYESDQRTEALTGARRLQHSMQSGQVRQALTRRRAFNANFVKAIGALNKYVVKRNGSYHFSLSARNVPEVASKLGIDPRMASILLKSLQKKNARLRAARVTQNELDMEAPVCAGQSAVQKNWWGNQIWVNECDTKTLIKALQASVAIGGGCAALVPEGHVKLVCGVVGAISGISAAGIDAIDTAGGNQGLIVYQPWVGPPWVWHQ